MAVKVGILGAASYVAGELIKLLLAHPEVEITYLESETFAGQQIGAAHPGLAGLCSLSCQYYQREEIVEECAVLFICKAHTQSMKYVAELLDSPLKIIDLSADFRLKNAALYQHWYGQEHSCPEALSQAVYGLPELNAEQIKTAKLIANPGCYPTSVILGVAPLLKAGVVKAGAIFVDSYSGLSGAGKTPKRGFNLFVDAYGNIKPYKAGVHQHLPEMEQELQHFSEDKVQITFIPHIAPLERGMLSSIALTVTQPLTDEEISGIYGEFYSGQPFILPYASLELTQVKSVVGSNFCGIGWFYDERTKLLVVTTVIDNVLKGAAGQAVQCMNLMWGWEQTTGLPWGEVLSHVSGAD